MKRNNLKIAIQILIPLVFIVVVLLVYQSSGRQSVDQGRQVYEKNCANCHGAKGEGLKQLIPPLTDTAYLHTEKLACIIRYGISGPLTVSGKEYAGAMPTNYKIENDEIAALINYISNELNGLDRKVTLPEVNKATGNCLR